MQTLRDRVLGKIDIDSSTSGRAPVLSLEEEAKLVNHLQEVAKLGYGYSRQEVVDAASDYAFELGKCSKDQPLTLNWFVKFFGRWPELRVLKPRSLDIQRAKSASSAAVDSYFVELENILLKYDLKVKPHLIYNVDEKGIAQDHKPPYIVAGKDYHPQSVTAGRSKTTTILGCGSASGVAVPTYFVFAGKRMLPELMTGATPEAAETVSDSGWSNSSIFREYLQEHFINYIPQHEPGQHLLLLLDGHKSHIYVSLLDWAKVHEIVLFVLPAHTSHILQPLDIGCYGPFQKMYHNECHKFMRSASCAVTRYDICSLACKVYSRALSAEKLHASFLKTGIFPLDKTTISKESTMPAEVFIQPDNGENLENEAVNVEAKRSENQNQTDNIHQVCYLQLKSTQYWQFREKTIKNLEST